MPSAKRSQLMMQLGFTLLTVMVFASVWMADRQRDGFAAVRHTLEVQTALSTVLSDFQDAETAQRGFLLTGRSDFLAPYKVSLGRIDEDLARLAAATADNPGQTAGMMRLHELAGARRAELGQTISQYQSRDRARDAASAQLDRGKTLMDQIHTVVDVMKAKERTLLQTREQVTVRQAALLRVGLVANGLLIFGVAFTTLRQAHLRLVAANATAAELLTANQGLKASAAALKAELENREAAEAQVRQMQKMESIGQLTGGIAHDFNNMLAIVIGSLDIAKRRLDTDRARALVCIDNALDGARRAALLTARLLAFSRQLPLDPRALDVNKLVSGMSEMLRHTIGEHLRVETVLAGGLWATLIDPGQLENAILNLVINARDAMPDGGRLTVETSNAHLDDAYASANAEVAPGQYVMISVTDSGSGMPPEMIDKVFEPFFTTKGLSKGTGLGLSQVHGFVKQSGGHVKIYSEPGHGTTVKIYLPRLIGAEAIADAGPPTLDPKTARAKTGEVVLVVEDDEKIRFLSVEALRDFGYTCVQAGDASQALAVLAVTSRIDLLFTDIVMPDMNGRQLSDIARQQRPGLKVLYTTGFTKNAVVHNGVLDAGVALIPKPFTVDQLAVKVRLVLDGADTNRPAKANRPGKTSLAVVPARPSEPA
jgi:signal transduction histidine kinase/CheY-like chemotaxis protein